MQEKKIESNQFKCSNCGGNLVYKPSAKKLFCDKCYSSFEIKEESVGELHSLYEKRGNSESYSQFIEANKMFKCNNCGASVILNKYEISKKCPYCDASLVIDEKNIPGINPDAVIPFAFDKEKAGEIFCADVKKRFFAPRKFKKQIPESEISALYIPAFSYFGNSQSKYDGRLYTEHTVTDRDGHSHTERRYFYISGSNTLNYSDVVVESCSHISQKDINGVLPYRYGEKKGYKNEYLLGYSVEHYDKDVDECVPTYKTIVSQMIRGAILKKYSYSGVDYLNVKTDYSNEKYYYYILPVYRFEYQYKKKKYSTYMNAQTGKVDKNIPKSGLKIAMCVIFFVLLFLLPLILSIVLSN